MDFDIIANPYQALWDDILNLLTSAMLSEGNKTITFETRSGVHTINSDDIKAPEEIKVFLSLFSNTAVLMAMFIEIQKLVIKLSEANASYVLHLGDADMYFYDDCQLM